MVNNFVGAKIEKLLYELTPNPLSGKPKRGLLICITINSPSLFQQRGGIQGGEFMQKTLS